MPYVQSDTKYVWLPVCGGHVHKENIRFVGVWRITAVFLIDWKRRKIHHLESGHVVECLVLLNVDITRQ